MALAQAAEGLKTVNSALPAVALALPLAGAAAVLALGGRERARNWAAVVSTAATFACVGAMFPAVMSRGETLSFDMHILFGHFRLAADSLGLAFCLVASFLWLAATLYSASYIQHEERRTRFNTFLLLTEAATLGVFLASDFFVLFVFFELMGLLAYMLVVHNQSFEARHAGVRYIFMTVYGGLSLLMGILLYLSYSGTTGFQPLPGAPYLTTSLCFVAAGFMMGGFGVKAGMVPVHVWLPLAHPAAPSPASALLSGVMINAGAYGILRIIQTFQVPSGNVVARGASLPAEQVPTSMFHLHQLGWVIIMFGLLTMVVGMVLALFQDNVKRLLAYSSISQMGFILVGLGVGAYLGAEGALGLAGGIEHIINHAMFKGLLFLGVGAVYYVTHEQRMSKLGGLWRKMPFTTALTCVAGLGLMGITLFSGFASKTLLHHAVLEALSTGGPWMRLVDMVFTLTAGGTVCYVGRLLLLTFFGRSRAEGAREVREVPWPMLGGMAMLAAGVLFFGFFPGLELKRLVLPELAVFRGLDPATVHHLEETSIFTAQNLLGILAPLAIGIVALVVGLHWDLFRVRLPEWAGIGYWYSRAEVGFLRLCFSGSRRFARVREAAASGTRRASGYTFEVWTAAGSAYRNAVRVVIDFASSLPARVRKLVCFARAQHLAGDIAFGVFMIGCVIAALSLILFWG